MTIKMDKNLIKEVKFSHERKAIIIAFTDGGMYGETGANALKTLKQLNDNDVPYVEIDFDSAQSPKLEISH